MAPPWGEMVGVRGFEPPAPCSQATGSDFTPPRESSIAAGAGRIRTERAHGNDNDRGATPPRAVASATISENITLALSLGASHATPRRLGKSTNGDGAVALAMADEDAEAVAPRRDSTDEEHALAALRSESFTRRDVWRRHHSPSP